MWEDKELDTHDLPNVEVSHLNEKGNKNQELHATQNKMI